MSEKLRTDANGCLTCREKRVEFGEALEAAAEAIREGDGPGFHFRMLLERFGPPCPVSPDALDALHLIATGASNASLSDEAWLGAKELEAKGCVSLVRFKFVLTESGERLVKSWKIGDDGQPVRFEFGTSK